MRRSKWLCLMLFGLMLGSFSATAQLKTAKVALGVNGGGTLENTDYNKLDNEAGFMVGGFIRHSIYGPLEGQASFAIGEVKRARDNFYKDNIMSGDYRLLFRLFSLEAFSPYIYGGGGGLYFEVKEPPAVPSPGAISDSVVIFVPVGLGFQLKLVSQLSLDVSAGYNFITTDKFNQIVAGDSDDGYFSAVAGLTFTGAGGDADSDKDGLTNKEEKRFKTDKKNPDTDGDGLNDGEELYQYRTHPIKRDTDEDGVDDPDEVLVYNTNPRKADTDGDGLSDADEIYTYKTDPNKKDSDGDGISDRDEVLVAKTDPNSKDSDRDGIEDYIEVSRYRTNPANADSDSDGLSDGEEVLTHQTDPLKADSDDDGLSDKEELLVYETDPNRADSDDGGIPDGEEVDRGTDPNNADDDDVLKVGEVGEKVVLDGILFPSGSASITSQSIPILEKAYQTLAAYPDMEVEIHGYTDNTGSRQGNLLISKRRADAVRDFLIRRGIAPGRITARGFGPDNPVAPNNTGAGRALNRRIEFVRVK